MGFNGGDHGEPGRGAAGGKRCGGAEGHSYVPGHVQMLFVLPEHSRRVPVVLRREWLNFSISELPPLYPPQIEVFRTSDDPRAC